MKIYKCPDLHRGEVVKVVRISSMGFTRFHLGQKKPTISAFFNTKELCSMLLVSKDLVTFFTRMDMRELFHRNNANNENCLIIIG